MTKKETVATQRMIAKLKELGFKEYGGGYAQTVGMYGFEYWSPTRHTLTLKHLLDDCKEYHGIDSIERYREAINDFNSRNKEEK